VGKNPEKIVSNPATNTIYVANYISNNISVINTTTNEKITDIPTANRPIDVVWNYKNNLIYVANYISNNISVINTTTNEKITDIPVGKNPRAIVWNYKNNLIYVANYNSSNITVISGENNTKITDIPVGKNPRAIVSNPATNTIYVANYNYGSVSVIASKNNTKITDIPVGKNPLSIVSNPATNTIYVSNSGSGSVSVIDGKSDKVVAGVTFQVDPLYSGYVECDGLSSPVFEYLYIYSGTYCIAKPNQGFEFSSWEENFNGNSTQLIQIAQSHSSTIFNFIAYTLESFVNFIGAQSILESFVNFIGAQSILASIAKFFNIQIGEPEAILKITKFGTFTANFKELPPPLPPEYWATLFGVVVTAFIGSWLTPTIIRWRTAKKHQVRLNDYQTELKDLRKDNKLDKNDMDNLDRLRDKVISGYTRGDITKDQYDVLLKNLSIKYNEIFKNEINSLKATVNNEDTIKLMNELDTKLDDVYLEEKIDKEHYTLLKDKIIELEKNNKNSNK
jgi:YVTN family beta-propeller protein